MVSNVKLVNLMEDCGVFLFRFHLHDHGCHPQPHRWIRDEPDARGDKDRDDRAGEKASKADGSQRAPKDNLGRNRRRSEERDEPEPLDPPIVNRRLSQVEQPMIPLDESRHDDRKSLSTVRTKSLAVDYQATTLAAGPSLGRFKVPFPGREALAANSCSSGRMGSDSLGSLTSQIVACRKCPRLVRHREAVARSKRAAFRDWEYWGRPVPGFGDAQARLLVVGLAPAAHGGNRTGRVFIGDRSGEWLDRALYRAGFANQATSLSRDDGLELRDCYIAAAVRCAPPENKPTRTEFARCQPFLVRETLLLPALRIVVVLGAVAMGSFLRVWEVTHHAIPSPMPRFRHHGTWSMPPITLIASYHPSQRNTQTGLLTESMFDEVFRSARRALGKPRRTTPSRQDSVN